jgi:hypothetical protein
MVVFAALMAMAPVVVSAATIIDRV